MYRNNGNCSPDGNGELNESDKKRMRRPNSSKAFKVELSYASKIPLQAIANALRGQESENYQEAIRVLDIILRQHAAKQCVDYDHFFFLLLLLLLITLLHQLAFVCLLCCNLK